MLSHHVLALLKFHSAWAEIWSVKNCRFPPFSCIPEGNFGRWPKPMERQKSRSRAAQWRQREQTVPGRPGVARASTTLASRGERSSSSMSSALIACSYGSFFSSLSPRVKPWGHSSQALGEESIPVAQCQAMAGKGQQEGAENREKCVLPTLTAGIWSTDLLSLLHSIPLLPLENMTIGAVVAHSASGLKSSWKGEMLLPFCIL